MNVTSVTKHYKRLSFVAALFSFLCVVGPVGFFFCQAMMVATITQKVVLGATAIAGLILGAINLLMKSHARSPFWIVMMAISLFLDKLFPFIAAMAIGCFLDEVVFAPLHKWARTKASINKEIDKRERLS